MAAGLKMPSAEQQSRRSPTKAVRPKDAGSVQDQAKPVFALPEPLFFTLNDAEFDDKGAAAAA